ncbi:hypothetical protein D9615_009859 [Tricholomella constricta]|uniref:CFEM domain-containing protein n=1 Tax=Tricholomella constricta TaxID=117010 RepID=A0A8H5GWT6_9AGAR|nr:hypothetical protein D9615_009859 [Tricholomella constricta]
MMLSKTFFALVLLAAGAIAQSSSGTAADPEASNPAAGISPCIIGCVQPAAEANGCVFTDAACVCASTAFQTAALTCLTEKCTAEEQQAAIALQGQQCAGIGGSSAAPTGSTTPTGSGSQPAASSTPTAPSTGSGSETGTGTGTAPPPAQNTNAAMHLGEGLGLAGAIVAGVVGLVL